MLTSGDVIDMDLGVPVGSEAGFLHPAVVVTAQVMLDEAPRLVHVVPLTSTARHFRSEVQIGADTRNGLDRASSAQCQHLRSLSVDRIAGTRGSVGPTVLAQIRETIALLLDITV